MVTFTVEQLVPNTEGILVGRQRKPRPFRAVVHAVEANTVEAAFQLKDRIDRQAGRPGTTNVKANGQTLSPGRPGWTEYQAMVARNTGRRI